MTGATVLGMLSQTIAGRSLDDLARGEQVLLFLVLGIAVLFLFAVGFAISVVLLRLKNIRRAKTWARLESKWESAILDVMAGAAPDQGLWDLVAASEIPYFVDFLLRYALRVTGSERETLRRLAEPYLPRILAGLESRVTEKRARHVQMLGELGLPEYASQIIRALDDPSPLVAMVAARALAHVEHAKYAEAIVSHLHRFANWSPNFLATILASMGPEAAPALRSAAAGTDGDPQARAVALSALAKLGDLPSGDMAVRLLETESDQEIQAASLRLLGQVGQREHLPLVRQMLGSESFVVRASAATVLGKIGGTEELKLLRMAYLDQSRWVAIHAARALRNLGDTRTLKEIASKRKPRASLALQILSELDE